VKPELRRNFVEVAYFTCCLPESSVTQTASIITTLSDRIESLEHKNHAFLTHQNNLREIAPFADAHPRVLWLIPSLPCSVQILARRTIPHLHPPLPIWVTVSTPSLAELLHSIVRDQENICKSTISRNYLNHIIFPL
jgi:hypothetical protein